MRYHKRIFAAACLFALLTGTSPCPAPAQENDRQQEQSISSSSEETKQGSADKELIMQLMRSGKSRPKIGLALGGGGARGAAHVGVLQVLKQEGIPIDCIAGTSIGAIVGGLHAAGTPVEDLEKIIQRKALARSFNTVPLWFRVAIVPVFAIPHLFGYSHYEGLYRGRRFRNYINSLIDPEHRLIEQADIPFCAVAASLMDGRSHCLNHGQMAKVIQASSAIPILRRPVEIDGNLYVDGGIVNNLPIEEVRKLGADVIIAVDVDETFEGSDLSQFKKIGSVPNRVINMILCRVDEDAPKKADVIVHPNVNGIKLLSTKKKDAVQAIAAGREAAARQIDQIRQAILRKSSQLNAGDE